jgi:tyrosine-protein phosphatase non-receptor type 23
MDKKNTSNLDICPQLPLISLYPRYEVKTLSKKELPKSLSKQVESLDFRHNLELVLSHVTQNVGSTQDVQSFVRLKMNASNELEKTKTNQNFGNLGILTEALAYNAEYLHHLTLTQSRLQLPPNSITIPTFAYQSFSDDQPEISKDLTFEKATTMYNLACLYMNIGQNLERNTDEESKNICVHYQKAAGYFQEIGEKMGGYQSEKKAGPGVEMNMHVMKIGEFLCLAQAQECCLDKAARDGRKPAILARVTQQIVVFYEEMMEQYEQLNTSLQKCEILQMFADFVKIKLKYFMSVTHGYAAQGSEAAGQYGEMLGHYKLAVERITEAGVLTKKCNHEALVNCVDLMENVLKNLQVTGKRDNDSIYMAKEVEQVELQKPAPLVRTTPFDISDLPRPVIHADRTSELFENCLPIEVQVALTEYEAMKEDLLRNINFQIDATNEELVKFKSSVPESENLKVPSFLAKIDGCSFEIEPELLQAFSIYKSLESEIFAKFEEPSQKLEFLVKGIDIELLPGNLQKPIIDALGKAKTDLLECEEVLGAFSVLQGVSTSSDFRLELSKKIASYDNIKLDKTAVKMIESIKMLHGKIQEMEAQRMTLLDRLKSGLENDNKVGVHVLKKQSSLANDDTRKQFFEEELSKHDATCNYIQQNLKAQDNILEALTEANIQLSATVNILNSYSKTRNSNISSIVKGLENWEVLGEKVCKGVEFFDAVMKKQNESDKKKISEKREPPKIPKKPVEKMDSEDMPDDLKEMIKNDPEFGEFLKQNGGWKASIGTVQQSIPKKHVPVPVRSFQQVPQNKPSQFQPQVYHQMPTYQPRVQAPTPDQRFQNQMAPRIPDKPENLHTSSLPPSNIQHNYSNPTHSFPQKPVYQQNNGQPSQYYQQNNTQFQQNAQFQNNQIAQNSMVNGLQSQNKMQIPYNNVQVQVRPVPQLPNQNNLQNTNSSPGQNPHQFRGHQQPIKPVQQPIIPAQISIRPVQAPIQPQIQPQVQPQIQPQAQPQVVKKPAPQSQNYMDLADIFGSNNPSQIETLSQTEIEPKPRSASKTNLDILLDLEKLKVDNQSQSNSMTNSLTGSLTGILYGSSTLQKQQSSKNLSEISKNIYNQLVKMSEQDFSKKIVSQTKILQSQFGKPTSAVAKMNAETKTMPYDHNRLILSDKNRTADYINGSVITLDRSEFDRKVGIQSGSIVYFPVRWDEFRETEAIDSMRTILLNCMSQNIKNVQIIYDGEIEPEFMHFNNTVLDFKSKSLFNFLDISDNRGRKYRHEQITMSVFKFSDLKEASIGTNPLSSQFFDNACLTVLFAGSWDGCDLAGIAYLKISLFSGCLNDTDDVFNCLARLELQRMNAGMCNLSEVCKQFLCWSGQQSSLNGNTGERASLNEINPSFHDDKSSQVASPNYSSEIFSNKTDDPFSHFY